MSIQKLFESLDESVFTPALKESLNEKFEAAVNEKANTEAVLIADELVSARVNELNEQAEKYSEYVLQEMEAKADAYGEYILEEAQDFQEVTLEKLHDYMDLVVQEFVSEAKTALEESVKTEKSDMLIEAFDAMLVSAGLEFGEIMESKEESGSEDRVNHLVQEVLNLKEENKTLIKMGLVTELSESLTLVQAERFKRLSNILEFTTPQEYATKLETILESVKESKDSHDTSHDTKENTLVTESSKTSKSVWSHLI